MADDDKEAKLKAEIERLKAEYGPDVIKSFLQQSEKRKGKGNRRGRPLLGDEVALAHMADLLVAEAYHKERPAARAVAGYTEGASPGAIEHRLCRKFRERRDELIGNARKRAQKRKEENYIFLRDFSRAFSERLNEQLKTTEHYAKLMQQRAEEMMQEMMRPSLELYEQTRRDQERLIELAVQNWKKAFP